MDNARSGGIPFPLDPALDVTVIRLEPLTPVEPRGTGGLTREHGVTINLAIGPSCFLQCRGCYNRFGKTHQRGGLIRAPQVATFMADCHEHGLRQVTLSGGDPLSHPDIFEILAAARAIGLYIKLDTVGSPLFGAAQTIFFGSNEVAEVSPHQLAQVADMIGIPLDGSTDDVQRRFRMGRSNYVREAVTIAQSLSAHGATVCINTVVHRGNCDDVGELAGLLVSEVRPQVWQLFEFEPLGPMGSHPVNRARFELQRGQFEEAVREAHMIAGEHMAVEGKSRSARVGIYIIVNDAGEAFVPGITDDKTISLWEMS